MERLESENHCSQCNAEIPSYSPQGLCPRCMIQHGLDEGAEQPTVLDRDLQGDDAPYGFQPLDGFADSMLPRGTRLGVFRIGNRLGTGGQGDVYLAHDSKLDRDVAIKVLPAKFLSDPERLARFEQEARILASLNHPNIGALYDLREEAHLHYLVMELVDGRTLSECIARGPIGIQEALRISIQIAEALEAAHERGIVHRDLKPANIMLNEKGGVKVLDFGIAKALEPKARSGPDTSAQPITTTPKFSTGERIIGTPAYMSPEQRQALPVDRRTDIWALGVILYEMLTGRHLCQAVQIDQSTFYIDQATPRSLTQVCADAQPGLTQVLERMLETSPDDRFQTITEALGQLRAIHRDLGPVQFAAGNVTPPAPSVAILPFVNIDGDPSNEYFGDGLAEELICGLSKIPGLHVVARSSAFRFRGKDLDARDVGSQLGASSVLEGSVRRAGNRLRVIVKLVSTADGFHLWSERYDREITDVFVIQEEIAVAIVGNLRSEILDEARTRLSVRYTGSPEAHDLYLKGRYHLNSVSPERISQAIDFFRLALHRDPGYAMAYAGLAECYCLLGLWSLIDPKEAIPEATSAAQRALALDETLAEVHHALGLVQSFCGEWQAARLEFKRAIELRPDHAFGRACYAMHLRFTAERDKALTEMRLALSLEPHSVAVNAAAAYLLFSLRLYDEAIKQSEKTIAMEPNFFQAHGYLAFAYARKGLLEKSIAEWQALLSQRGYQRLAWGVQHAFEQSGYEGAMTLIARRSVVAYYLIRMFRWLPRGSRRYCSPMFPAVLYAEAGKKALAFKWLEKAHARRTPLMIGLTEDPLWDRLRGDPRFREITSQIAQSTDFLDV